VYSASCGGERSAGVIHRQRLVAASLIVAVVWGVLPAPALAARASGPALYVPSAILVGADGAVLWSKRPDAQRRPASTIKLLNALVVRDKVPLDQTITVSRKAAEVDDGAVGLKAGEKLTVRQLLGVMLVHSANGAAEALATGIAGDEKKYVAMMNAKAHSLGLKHTRAADPHGLSPANVCSASDLATIARTFMSDPVLRAIALQRGAWLPWGVYWSTDKLLGSYRGLEGIKTGYTDPAGYCFVAAAKRNGVELFGVVLGADAPADRFTQMRRLLDWGFAHASRQEIVSDAATMGVVGVDAGREPTVTVHAAKTRWVTVVDCGPRPTAQVSLPPSVKAPIAAGQVLGAVEILCGTKVVDSVPLVADAAVAGVGTAPAPAPSAADPFGANDRGWPWHQIVLVWAGLGRLLGI
jgi:D-alanyl-D-alanine carboxypeptidase (penicillin-binding protein 5/6)